jgi:flagellar hook-associated protein 1
MTIPTGAGMNTALSGLEAYQAGIDTTGENISNANTLGYSRQTVNLGESSPLTLSTNGRQVQVGTGTSIEDVTRQRDQYLDIEYRGQNQGSAYWSEMSGQLDQVQTALGDSNTTGTGYALSQLWSAFSGLAKTAGSPSGTAAQTAVTGAADTLISTLQSVQGQLGTVQTQAAAQLSALAGPQGEVAQDAAQINTLNVQIKQQTQAGMSPNTLLDQRDQLLDDLSSLASTSTVADPNGDGGVTVTFNGQTLVDSSTDAVALPTLSSYSASSGGKMGALAEIASGTTVSGLSGQLTTLAQDIASSVNGATGQTLFSVDASGNLSFDPTGLASVTQGQASAAAALSGGTADADYASFVDNVGTAAQTASNSATTAQALTTAVQNQRQSVSGVSLDEEMTNLITFQQGYEASAKMLSTMNSVIQTLISSVGGAGL